MRFDMEVQIGLGCGLLAICGAISLWKYIAARPARRGKLGLAEGFDFKKLREE
jgi:hypothetical protein